MGKRRAQPLRPALRLRPDRRLRPRHRQQADEAGPRPQGRRAARPAGPADAAAADPRQRLDGKGRRHHPLRLRRARRLGDRGRPGRQRSDPGRHPRRDQRRQGDRMRDQAGAALLLRLGTEPDRPRVPDRRPPGQGTAARADPGSDQRMAGSGPPADQARKPAADRRRRLPERVRRGQTGLRTEAGPDCEKCSQPATYYLFEKDKDRTS